jgi:hypothetical protein
MFDHHRFRGTLLGAIGAALLASAPSVAQSVADSDAREVASYVLTEAGLAKYTQAVKNLAPLAKRLSDACKADDDSDNVRSLDDMVARFDAVPGVSAAIRSASLTTREYFVFTLSVFKNGMAAWALDQPGGKLPPGTSMANVNFYRAHQAAIKRLGNATKAGDCDSGGNEDDSQESEDDSQE